MNSDLKAYWVARSRINDPQQYARYTELVPEIIDRYGGRILARGGQFRTLEGPEHFHRFVVIEFPSLERAVACHASAEYQAAMAFRQDGVGEVELVIVEGLAPGALDGQGSSLAEHRQGR